MSLGTSRTRVARIASICVLWIGALAAPTVVRAQGGTNAGEAAEGKEREVTRPPKLVREVEAEYTEEALEAEVEGKVRLKLEIDAEGNVDTVEVVDGLGHGLDAAAKRAAKQFKFRPAKINGKPAPVVLGFEVRFELPKRPATLQGRITEKEGEGDAKASPVEGVSVAIEYVGDEYEKAPKARTTTDEKGRFQFREVPPGSYRIRIEAKKFKPLEQTVRLESDETLEVAYQLPKKPLVLTGRVLEAGTRDRLSAVRVRVLAPPEDDESSATLVREVYTDDQGRFGVRGLAAGSYRVEIDAEGYEEATYREKIPKKGRLQVRYYLEAKYYDDYTVTTTARREAKSVDRETLELEEIRRIPGTGGDAVRAVQNLPGVARPSFATGQLVVRGSTPQSTRTFLQGDEVPLIYHFLAGPAVINSEMLSSVDFYPGNYRARYGRALSGVVNLQTRDPKSDRIHGFTEVDLIDATLQLEGPISEDVSFAVSGRRSYIDAILPAVLPEDGPGFRVAPRYYDYQGWLTWDVDGENRLEFSLYGSNDRLEALFEQNNPQGNAQFQTTGLEFGSSFHRGQARWEWRPKNASVENDLMVSFGRNRFGFEVARNLFFRLDFLQAQIRDDFRWKLSDAAQLNFGTDTQIGQATYSAEFPGNTGGGPTDPGASRNSGQPNLGDVGAVARDETEWVVLPAVYSELKLNMTDSLELIPGLRLDYFGGIEEFALSPRFNGRYQITDKVTLKGGVGMFTQQPDPGQVTPNFGNPNLTYQKAAQYSAGTVITPLEYLEVDTTLFYRDLYDLVVQTDEVRRDSETGEVEPLIYDNAGRGRAYGLELLVRHYPANKFFGWTAYTLSRSERKDPKTGDWNVFEFDQTHNVTVVAGYNLPWNVDVSARFRLTTGNPQTPVAGSVWNADTDSYVPIYGEPNSVRGDTFHQLDLRVDKQFVFNTWRFGAYIDVINVYNATNQEGTRYNYDYTESQPIPGLPIIPTLGVNGRF